MLRLLSMLIFIAIAVVCIWLAVANRQVVAVSLSPLPITARVELFYVGLIGAVLGILAVLPKASLRLVMLRRRLSKTQKALRALENRHADLLAERDALAANVRPEDKRFAQAQVIEAAPQGTLTGPSTQTVLPQ